MALFKLSVSYEGKSSEEIVEVEAENSRQARMICEDMVANNKERMEHLARFNVYDSKIMERCRLCPYDFRIDVYDMLKFLENDV